MARVAVGISGGIGAYKAVEIVRGFQKRGHEVVAIMTRNATRFVGPLTLQAITGRPVAQSLWAGTGPIDHIALADEIDVLVVAPATARTVARMAHGLADDILSTVYLATKAPVLVVPAMNVQMFEHAATQANLATLVARGVHVMEPDAGYLACGWQGKGRLPEPDRIVDAALGLLSGGQSLAGRRVVVSAGPTYEDLDPVRYLGNRSSGKMGVAVAAEALARGAAVTLVFGPSNEPPPTGATVIRVRRAAEMADAVLTASSDADVVVMAAAVADYQPAATSGHKIKKGHERISLDLVRTPDILLALGTRRHDAAQTYPILVGFAAETDDVVAQGRDKLVAKRVDMMVANDVTAPGAGFEAETNAVTLIGRDWDAAVSLRSKRQVASAIWDRIEGLLDAATGDVTRVSG